MITEASAALKERTGSSRAAIQKSVIAKYGASLNLASFLANMRAAIAHGVKSGAFVQVKGSFKLGKVAKAVDPAKKAAAAAKKAKAAAAKCVCITSDCHLAPIIQLAYSLALSATFCFLIRKAKAAAKKAASAAKKAAKYVLSLLVVIDCL